MPRWPIRAKLIVGLSLVLTMMTLLLGGAVYGLRSFHDSNLILTDQLRELGVAKSVLEAVVALHPPGRDDHEGRAALARQVDRAREVLAAYREKLLDNASRGKRFDDGRDEMFQAFSIDEDLTALLLTLRPQAPTSYALPGTQGYLTARDGPDPPTLPADPDAEKLDRAVSEAADPDSALAARIDRLRHRVMRLPAMLYFDFYLLLQDAQSRYQSSRITVWVASVLTLGLLLTLATLLHRWVVNPIRLLMVGVRRVARGSFRSRIELRTGDEMQDLAEAFNDMTAQLRVTYEDLEQQVRDRSRQLVRSERLAGVGFLAAGVAHEINNPLASIAFCAEGMERRLAQKDGTDAEALIRYARMIQEEAFRCKRITEKLLDFSRCGELRRERSDLAELVGDVVEMMRHMGKYRDKTIRFDPPTPVHAHVDPQEMKQVVLNLVVNALDSMEAGGTLAIGVEARGAVAEMAFADDGHGIAPEVLENIFEPFYTNRPGGKGTGLGLSITHRIVSQHQGEILAASPGPGRGATFTVRVPVGAPEEPDGRGTTWAA